MFRRYIIILFCLLFQVLAFGQKLKKPNKKSPPGTVLETEWISLSNSTTAFFGQISKLMISVKIMKTDTGSLYMRFSGDAGSRKFEIKKNDPINIVFTDSSYLYIPAMRDGIFESSRNEIGIYFYDVYGDYIVSKELKEILTKKDIASIRITRQNSNVGLFYIIAESKRTKIKEALLLFD